jgi:putative membrane protein
MIRITELRLPIGHAPDALVLMLVSAVVSGFTISGFWTAIFASIFISLFSLFVSGLVF